MIVYETSDVYGISRELPLNYVSREGVDDVLLESLIRDRHIVIYGSSKQGKTSLRKNCMQDSDYITVHCLNQWGLSDIHAAILKKSGYEISQSTTRTSSGRRKILATLKGMIFGVGAESSVEQEKQEATATTTSPLELDPEDVNDIVMALNGFTKKIVLEDFHYLQTDIQKEFAVALKAYHEASSLCFIVIGVWIEGSRLTVYNGDLTGRITDIDADKWSVTHLAEVVTLGEKLLNISFDTNSKNEMVQKCLGNVYILQEVCRQVCVQNNISKTVEGNARVIEPLKSVDEIVKEIVEQQSSRYRSFITQFAAGFQDTALQMYKWLLYPVLSADVSMIENGITFRQMRDSIRAKHPEGANLNVGNLTQALQYTAALQVKKDIKPIIFDYDGTNTRLNVVDRGFIIWLATQERSELLELADLPLD